MEHNTTQNTQTLKERVREAINSGKVPMHSHFHYVFKTILLTFTLVSIFVLSTFLINIVLFSIHFQSHHVLLGFGTKGWLMFLALFPWMLFIIDIGLILLSVYLFQSFRFGYKTPTLYLGAFLLFCILIAGFLFEVNSHEFNMRMLQSSEEGKLPSPFHHMMQSAHVLPLSKRPVCRCEVVEVRDNNTLVAKDTRTGSLLTFVLHGGSAYATTSNLASGDILFIAGEYDGDGDRDDVVEIIGIRRILKGENVTESIQ